MVDDQVDEVDYDFDAAWAERTAAAPRVRIHGAVYTLPVAPPAKVILFAARAARKGGDLSEVIDLDDVLSMLRALLGEDNLARIIDSGIGVDQLGDILGYCMRRYKQAPVDGEGEAATPAPGADRTTISRQRKTTSRQRRTGTS